MTIHTQIIIGAMTSIVQVRPASHRIGRVGREKAPAVFDCEAMREGAGDGVSVPPR